jgi:peptidoglycan/LPS O-acetylase OafA/YrhL
MAERKDPIASIQFLRAVAAVGVVVMHNFFFFDSYAALMHLPLPSLASWWQFKTIGGIGVSIFFVISGFIMAHLAALNPEQTAASFFGRRLSRIVPIYWLITAFFLWRNPSVDNLYVLKSFVFFPTKEIFPLVGVGWTLVYEMFFYFLFGTIVVALRRSVWWIALVFAGFAVASRYSHSYVIQFYSSPIVWNFLVGIVIQRIYRSKIMTDWSPLIFAMGVSAIVFSMATFIPSSEWTLRTNLHWGPASALLVLGTVSLEAFGFLKSLFQNRLVQAVGASSYSLYLIHGVLFINVNFYLLHWMDRIGINPNIEMLGLVVFASALAYLSYRLIEIPSQQFLRMAWARTAKRS